MAIVRKLLLILFMSLFLIGADFTTAVTVTTSATEIVTQNPNRRYVVIFNNGSDTVYIGFTAADCTVATGLPLKPGGYIRLLKYGSTVYGITSSGTVEVRVWDDVR